MEASAVSLARSVLDGALHSALTGIADEAARLLGVRKEVEFIRNELEMMQAFLKVASALPEGLEHRSTVKTWVKQVRELAYDVEDCLHEFALYAAAAATSCAGAWLPRSLRARRRVATKIRELKGSIEELTQRNLRYHVIGNLSRAPAAAAAAEEPPLPHDSLASTFALEESRLVGRDMEKNVLTGLISGTSGSLRVISVWGMGGMGKSSLVRAVYNGEPALDEFDCCAWLTVPHPLESSDELKRRLRKKLGADDVVEFLREKRYLIVVDDLSSPEEWDCVVPLLVQNSKGSRVIVTTRREDVALHCATPPEEQAPHVYKLEPLSDKDSKRLLFQKVSKMTQVPSLRDSMLPDDMSEEADKILKKCRGLPLAIATMGGLLANRPKTSTEWMKIQEHLGSELESNLRDITKVIASSYDGLPYHLKSCFLYLSIFPENHQMRHTRLMRRWMAEGYVAKRRDMTAEDVGKSYYNELISRSMIQPSNKRCRVHSMVHEIILSRSIEENQLFLIDKHCSDELTQIKIRHLVVTRWSGREEELASMNLSCIRSFTAFGECPISLISPKMRLLRVLDLEDTEGLKNQHLKHIGELRHLKYLGLRGTSISKLPPSLQKLRYLETLDIRDTKVTQLPGGTAKLERLHYLLAGVDFSKKLLQKVVQLEAGKRRASFAANAWCGWRTCGMDQFSIKAPEGIGELRNLCMLGVVHVSQGTGVAREIGKLTGLRRLGVAGVAAEEGEQLCESLGKLSRLERLEVRSKSLEFLEQKLSPPKHLLSLRLCGHLGTLPAWIASLNDLTKVKLLATQLQQEDVCLLGKLRNLALLGLWERSYTGTKLCFHNGTFLKLKFLDLDGLEMLETVTIEEGAMPGLEHIWVNCCRGLNDDEDGLRGVPFLLNLNELRLNNSGEKEHLVKILQEQVSKHQNRPKFLVSKSIAMRSSVHGPTSSVHPSSPSSERIMDAVNC